ncbi:MAG: acetyl-CoA C-acetyltransferase [Deltaproteobacteria bacterium]|nr:acetyl-CoA C-acetyltransferase [Deltaproteobacteria bacterium]
MIDALVFDALRTPRGAGKPTGALYSCAPLDLLASALRAAPGRVGHTRESLSAALDELAVGCVTQVGEQGGCVARTALLAAGYDPRVPAVTLNRFCGSGLEAVNDAAAKVRAGFCALALAGGVESMSRAPMGSDGGALLDPRMALGWGLVPQGVSADLLATLHGITRADVDAYALESQRRAAAAEARGALARGRVPVLDRAGATLLDRDEHPRPQTTLEDLARLTPAFAQLGEGLGLDALTRRVYPQLARIDHVHTAGSSSGVVDGAALALLGSAEAGRRLGLRARARVRAAVSVGSEPVVMLSGVAPAAQAALWQAGMRVSDVDLFEVNEAFAAVPLYFMDALGVPHERVNVNGGAIALGHPLGATGAMLLGAALEALEERGEGVALVTLCIGGGMGIATIIERV